MSSRVYGLVRRSGGVGACEGEEGTTGTTRAKGRRWVARVKGEETAGVTWVKGRRRAALMNGRRGGAGEVEEAAGGDVGKRDERASSMEGGEEGAVVVATLGEETGRKPA